VLFLNLDYSGSHVARQFLIAFTLSLKTCFAHDVVIEGRVSVCHRTSLILPNIIKLLLDLILAQQPI